MIFLSRNNISECDSDPFRLLELNNCNISNKGASPKAVAKPRKLSRILQTHQPNSHETNTFASEKRSTKRTRKNVQIKKVQFLYLFLVKLIIYYINNMFY